jgi:hypothetical protein
MEPAIESEAWRMKPHVICLMASSVDGRTLYSRWGPKSTAGNLFGLVDFCAAIRARNLVALKKLHRF